MYTILSCLEHDKNIRHSENIAKSCWISAVRVIFIVSEIARWQERGQWTVVQIIIISIRSESQRGSAYMQYWSGLYNNIDTHLSTTLLVMPHQLLQRRCSAWHGGIIVPGFLNMSMELFFAITYRKPNIFAAESLLIMSPSLLWCEVCVYTDLSTVKPFLGNGPEPLTLIRPFATSTAEK